MKNLLSGLVMLLAVGASAQTKPWLEGQHSGVKKPMAVAIKDPQTWREIWRRHDASAPLPEVDFTQQSVVVVFLGEIERAGVNVTIVVQQDPLDSRRINVFYRRTTAPRAFAAQIQSEPYAMVKIPRAATIDVEQDGRMGVPEGSAFSAGKKRDDKKIRALIDTLLAVSFDSPQ